MTVRGIGVDLVSVDRITRVCKKFPERFINRIFTENEKKQFEARGSSMQSLASRFAAKEAVLKAIGCGIGPATMKEVEIISLSGKQPATRLHGSASFLAGKKDINNIFISMSHEKNIACAFVTATT
ncbi:MAG: holo-ACP synthase [Bacillota bacterium]